MPPQKSVTSLQTLSQVAVGKLVITACLVIEKKYGSYLQGMCKNQIRVLQKYLLSNIGPLLDDIFMIVQDVWPEQRNVNLEILYAVVLRNDITTLKIGKPCGHTSNFVANCISSQQIMNKRSFANLYHSHTQFWIKLLNRFKCLVNVDICRLNLGPDPAAYQNIIKNCKGSLKTICFTPSLSTEHFIVVLNDLGQCKELVSVNMFWPANRLESPNEASLCAITNLVESLTKLQCLDIRGIGEILLKYRFSNVKFFRSSSLTHLPLHCTKLSIEQIDTLLRDCPKLKVLEFSSLPFLSAIDTRSEDGRKLVKILSQENLSYTALWLPVNPYVNLDQLWTLKGPQLVKLKLVPCSDSNFNGMPYSQFLTIGHLCPNLEALQVQAFAKLREHPIRPRTESFVPTSKMFSRLKFLHLHNSPRYSAEDEATFWDPAILSLIMENATNMVHVELLNILPNMFEATLAHMRSLPDSILNLEVVHLFGPKWDLGCVKELLHFVLDFCPKLTLFRANSTLDSESEAFIRNFQNIIKYKNLDFRLKVMNIVRSDEMA